MSGLEEEFDKLLGIGEDNTDVSSYDDLLGSDTQDKDPLEEEFDKLLANVSTEQTEQEEQEVNTEQSQPETTPTEQTELDPYGTVDPTITFEKSVPSSLNVDIGVPTGQEENLPKYAPSRAIGAQSGEALFEPMTEEGIPTRKPRESTPLSGLVTGVEKSIPFFGKEGSDIEQIKQEQPGSVIAGEIAGNVAQVLGGGVGIGKLLAKTAVNKSPLLLSALSRVTPAMAVRGGQTAEQVINNKSDIESALFDTIVESGGGAAFSMLPEIIMPPGVAQAISQPMADLIYQGWVDAMRNEGKVEGLFTKDWFLQQIPTLAASLGFGIKDMGNGNFKIQQDAMRKDIAKAFGAKPKVIPKSKIINSKTGETTEDFDNLLLEPQTDAIGTATTKSIDTPRHRELDRMIEEAATEKEVITPKQEPDVATKLPYDEIKDKPIPEADEIIQESMLKQQERKPIIPENKVLAYRRRMAEQQKQKEIDKESIDIDRPKDEAEMFATTPKDDNIDEEAGFIRFGGDPKDKIDSKQKKPTSGFVKMIKDQFTTMGSLPKEVFKKKIARDGWVNAELKDIERTVNEFRNTAPKAFGLKNLDDKTAFEIDKALKGDKQMESLPKEIQPTIEKMRKHIDAMSQKLIDEGVIEGDLETKIKENIGFYTSRSYRVFDDPKWAKKVPEEVRNNAKAFLRQEMLSMDSKTNVSEDRMNGLIDEFLYKEGAPISILASGSKLGSKALGILKRRKEIAPEIRALWGEYKNADVNYANSVSKMSRLIANHHFLSDVKSKGKNKFFFQEATRKDGESYSVKIAAKDNPSMRPLTGKDGYIYTTKEIKEAFEESTNQKGLPNYLKLYIKANSAAKYSKTIGSFMTHVRNTTGNVGFAIANGHYNIFKGKKALKTAIADFSDKGNVEQRKYIRELTELGVIGDGALFGEIKNLVKDVTRGNIETLVSTLDSSSKGLYKAGKHIGKGLKKSIKTIEKAYGSEDDVWKIYAFENEYARYKKALPDMDDKELKKKVANIVRDTYPTYSMIPKAIKSLRRFPLVGSFVSFPFEVMRTAKNTIGLAADELFGKNKALRKIGAQRLAGLTTAATLTTGLSIATKFRYGINKEKEKAALEGMPPWGKNTEKIYLSPIKKGKGFYVDLGYTDPHSYLKGPIKALINNEDWEQKILETGAELLSPFLSEDILTSKIIDLRRNKRKDGRPIFNEQDTFDTKTFNFMSHVWDAIEPGTISGIERMYKAYSNQDGTSGTAYDAKTEIAAQLTGVRVNKFDFPRSLRYKAFKFKKDLREASWLAKSKGKDFSQSQKMKIYKRFSKTIQSGKILGLNDKDIYKILKEAKVPKKTIKSLLEYKYLNEQP